MRIWISLPNYLNLNLKRLLPLCGTGWIINSKRILGPSTTITKQIIVSLLFITPLGFVFKIYSGPAHMWFNNYGAGLLYEIFWILVNFFFAPRMN